VLRAEALATRIFKVADGVVTMNDRVSFPARAMFGVIGLSPESGHVSTFPGTSRRQHGRSDERRRRHGEISGTGVEIGGTALIKVGVIKSKRSGWPITETADAFYTHATSQSSIDDALRGAGEEASRLLVDGWDFSSEDAFMFFSVAGDLGIAAYYQPSPGTATARMRVPKLASNPAPFRL
jgi:amidase